MGKTLSPTLLFVLLLLTGGLSSLHPREAVAARGGDPAAPVSERGSNREETQGGVAGSAPNDPDFALQWGHHNTGQMIAGKPGLAGADVSLLGSPSYSMSAADITVAIVGTGVDPHPEYADRLLEGGASVGDLFSSLDTNGCARGTRAAGVIAAAVNDGTGIAGLCPDVRILPVRSINSCAGAVSSPSDLANAIIWAVDHDADVVLVTLMILDSHPDLEAAVAYALSQDVLVVAPAGDDGTGLKKYPAAYPDCLAVGATTNTDERWTFSNFGPFVDIVAPGADTWTTVQNDIYAFASSTVLAAAYVAGAAAVLRLYNADLSAGEIQATLLASADDLGPPGWDSMYGAGRLNMQQAVVIADVPDMRIEHPLGLPDSFTPGTFTLVTFKLIGVGKAVPPAGHLLFYAFGDGPLLTAPLVWVGGDLFEATIPPAECGSPVKYYAVIVLGDGTVVLDPPDAPIKHYGGPCGLDLIRFHDDLEQDLGWTKSFVGASTTGKWVRVEPYGNYASPGYDYTPDYASYCYVTGQNGEGSPGAADVDYGPVVLMSPVIPLDAKDARITFAAWFYSMSGQTDTMTVELSRDGGATWVLAEEITHEPPIGWKLHELHLSDYPGLVGQSFRIRFTASDLTNDSLTEAGIDELTVTALACFSPDGDWTDDGDVDKQDFKQFVPCRKGPDTPYSNPQCETFDFDFNNLVDLLDAAVLQNAFTGAP